MNRIKYTRPEVYDRWERILHRRENQWYRIALFSIPVEIILIWLLVYPGAMEMVDNINPMVWVWVSLGGFVCVYGLTRILR